MVHDYSSPGGEKAGNAGAGLEKIDHAPRRILLVNDEVMSSMAQGKALACHGYEVASADSGEEAVELVKDDAFINLVLMDILLRGGCDGAETARRIMALRNVPIVFLVPHGDREAVEKVRDIPGCGCVTKDSGDFMLLSTVEMALKLFEARRVIEQKNEELGELDRELTRSENRYRVLYDDMLRDISEHRKVADALRESEAHLSAIMESTDDFIWTVDPEDYRLLTFNATYRNYFMAGENLEVAPGAALDERLPPANADIWREIYANALREGSFQIEMGKLADSRVFLFSGNPLFRDGRPYAISMIGKDITGRKKAEEALQRAHYELQRHVGRLKESTRELRAALTAKNLEIAERKRIEQELHLLTLQLERIREEERSSVARELHDELGQSLTALRFELSNLRNMLPESAEPVVTILDSIEALLGSMLFAVHRISSELRPRILDDLGLVDTLKWLADNFQQRTGIRCTCHFSDEELLLERRISTALFRICQEALTNVARHAMASEVAIRVMRKKADIHLSVVDNGIGIVLKNADALRSFGISGMKERVHLLGGKLAIKGKARKGTTVAATLPLITKGVLHDENTDNR